MIPRGGTGDSSEAKDGCNECDDQECERPTEHDLPFCFLGIALRTGTGRMARRILERSDQKVLARKSRLAAVLSLDLIRPDLRRDSRSRLLGSGSRSSGRKGFVK